MKKFNIGIDIDGCLNYFYLYYYDFILKNYNLKIDLTKYDNSQFLKNKLGIEEYKNLELYFQSNIKNNIIKIEKFAKFIINLLSRTNNIYILTARFSNEKWETIKWLNKNNIIYDEIYFDCGNKGDICEYKNIDYMIEDSPYNVYNLLKHNIKTIVFNRPYNQEFYNGPLIYKVDNWFEIYNYIKEIQKKE